MVNYSIRVDNLIKFIIILAIFINGSLTLEDSKTSSFVFWVLLFALFCKIRQSFKSNKPAFLIGLFIEVGLIFYLFQNYEGFSYLLIYISIIDSLIYLDFEAYMFSFIASGFLIYFLKENSIDFIFLNILISILSFMFAYQIKKMNKNLNRIELLYDINRNYSYELEENKKRLENFTKWLRKCPRLKKEIEYPEIFMIQ